MSGLPRPRRARPASVRSWAIKAKNNPQLTFLFFLLSCQLHTLPVFRINHALSPRLSFGGAYSVRFACPRLRTHVQEGGLISHAGGAQWLKHSGKGTCEVCNHKFEFTPGTRSSVRSARLPCVLFNCKSVTHRPARALFFSVYAEDAPVQLPLLRVVQSCLRRTAMEWVPFASRILLVRP